MQRLSPLALALLALGCHAARASTAYGDLNNFDVINDTGQECHGFEIEIEGARSTDITYTYDWNHYNAPRISDDTASSGVPRVRVRYESTKKPDGTWAAYTAVPDPLNPLTPTDGHSCTNPSVNLGCEHFGVGFYGAPTAVRYFWLVDDGAGNAVRGPAVQVATPVWAYSPPIPPDPVINPVGVPAQAVAVIPAPEVPIPQFREFGEATWVKVIKTTSHSPEVVELAELVSADADNDGLADWTNGEPDETETEWKMLQPSVAGDGAKDEEAGLPDEMPDGDEVVTRRYEFYAYGGDDTTIDGETGEAMCDEVGDDGIHGLKNAVTVTDANGDSQTVDCTQQVVIGAYIGAQMAGFDAEAPLGLVDSLQDGEAGAPYVARTVVVGGNSPYDIALGGDLPPGLTLGEYTDPDTGLVAPGVLAGTPSQPGNYSFSVDVTDASGTTVGKAYTVAIGGAALPQYTLSAAITGNGAGTVSGSGIDCGATCSVLLAAGTTATLSASANPGSVFRGWSGDCSGLGDCVVTLANANASVTATFVQQVSLSVSKTGGGTGTVSGSGIDCGTTCTAALDLGAAASLNATAASGSVFTGWGAPCAGTGTCNLVVDADTTLSASFVPSTTKYTVTVTRSGSGTVSSTPKGINCGSKCSASFAVGSTVTLKAAAARKHSFTGWTGACAFAGSASSCALTITGNQSVGAVFN